jgi:hypothetical protein
MPISGQSILDGFFEIDPKTKRRKRPLKVREMTLEKVAEILHRSTKQQVKGHEFIVPLLLAHTNELLVEQADHQKEMIGLLKNQNALLKDLKSAGK